MDGISYLETDRFEQLNATVRWTVARSRLDGVDTIIRAHSRARMQTNLASSSKKKPGTPTGFRLSSFLRYMVSTPKTDTETNTAIFLHAKIYYNCLP